jgi:membrane protein insertase Oxa1/YidC/SpoIIIJ
VLIIQLPILIGLYRVFLGLPKINPDYLYSFIPVPETINMMFLGFVNMAEKSLVLALLVGISTYIQTSIASSGQNQVSDGSKQGEASKSNGISDEILPSSIYCDHCIQHLLCCSFISTSK